MAKNKQASPTTVRLSDKARKQVQVEADANHRTFTGQLEYIVEKHFKEHGGK